MAFQPFVLLWGEGKEASADAPAADPGLKLFFGFGGSVAAGDQRAHCRGCRSERFCRQGFSGHPQETRPARYRFHGVDVDTSGVVAFETASLAPGMRRWERDMADATYLAALPHPRRRRPFAAHGHKDKQQSRGTITSLVGSEMGAQGIVFYVALHATR